MMKKFFANDIKYFKKATRFLGASLLALHFIVPLTPVSATSLPSNQVQELTQHKAEIDRKNQEVAQVINRKKEELAKKKAELEQLKQKNATIQKELENLEAQAVTVEAEKERVAKQLAYAKETLELRLQEKEAALAALEKQQATYQERVSLMFYYRQRHWMDVLLKSKGLDGFFTNMRIIKAISGADKKLIDELKHSEEIAAKAEATANETMLAYKELLNDKTKQIQDLQRGIVDTQESRKELKQILLQRGTEEQDLQKTLAEQMAAQQKYEANSRELADKIAKIQQQNQAVNAAPITKPSFNTASLAEKATPAAPSGSGDSAVPVVKPNEPSWNGFVRPVWPIPGFTEIWSPYGYRNTSFDAGNGYVHTGTDISGPNSAGAPIVAAWNGVVVAAEAPSQGQMFSPHANYVQINHGNGLGTGYWHLLDVTVTVGQVVQAGQVIGHCGSTGMSTGPHLHFEVYDQNNPNRSVRNTVDPMRYLR